MPIDERVKLIKLIGAREHEVYSLDMVDDENIMIINNTTLVQYVIEIESFEDKYRFNGLPQELEQIFANNYGQLSKAEDSMKVIKTLLSMYNYT